VPPFKLFNIIYAAVDVYGGIFNIWIWQEMFILRVICGTDVPGDIPVVGRCIRKIEVVVYLKARASLFV
jgi:hypothetical protein